MQSLPFGSTANNKMTAQIDAIARLLRDDDPETVRLVKEQLLTADEDIVSRLQDLAQMDDESVSRNAREVLQEIAVRDAEDEFGLTCHFFAENGDLESACWQLARALGTAPVDPAIRKVDQWGRQFAVLVKGAVSCREKVGILTEFVAGELCFRGNCEHYYAEKNSLLPAVIDTRMGIPISLAMIYRMIAERAGVQIDGLNLPGHFVARHGDVIFDPFHKGKILSRDDCQEILQKQKLRLKSCHLEAATPRQILLRILANLLYVYDLEKNDCRRALLNKWLRALSKEH